MLLDRIALRTLLWRGSRSPLSLTLDSLHLKRRPYIAESRDGLKLRLEAGVGDWFTFLENLIRKDYLRGIRELHAGDVVADIGANIGAFAVLAARAVGPSGRVLAYEPDPDTAQRLRDNVALNELNNVTVINAAVGGQAGRATLYRHAKSAYSSLKAEVDHRAAEALPSVEVDVLSIHQVIADAGGRIRLLKLDCEGSEYEIVDALRQADGEKIEQISMELHQVPDRSEQQLIADLRQMGFDVDPTPPTVTAVRQSA